MAILYPKNRTRSGPLRSNRVSQRLIKRIVNLPPFVALPSAPPGTPSLWFSADKETAYNNDDPVDTLVDFGSLERNLTAAGIARPTYKTPAAAGLLNEKPSLKFDGGAQHMQTASFTATSQPTLVSCIVRADISTTNDAIFDGLNAGNRQLIYQLTGVWTLFAGSNAGDAQSVVPGDFVMLTALFDGTSSLLRLNGNESGALSPGAGVIDGLTLGAFNNLSANTHWDGDIVEFIYYDDTSYGTPADVETYLTTKYGSFPQS